MKATYQKLAAHFSRWREWELNPIVIKELRQGVRSWTVTGMLMLFLVILFLTSVGFLVSESFDVNSNPDLGGRMFSVFVIVLGGASLLFIPLYTGVRVGAERADNNPDLLYVSTLSPARIIAGKFFCSAYIVALFFSACMPFMAFTNLLRGVDLPTVFFILFFLFLIVCGANMVAIFLACLPVSRPFKFLFMLIGLILAISMMTPMVAFAYELMRSGIGSRMAGSDFWIVTSSALAVGGALVGLFYVLSVALISPPSANRALPVRLYLTGFWFVGGLLSIWWVAKTSESDRILAWAIPSFGLFVPALLTTISNADQLSRRVRRKIPASVFKRIPAFLFFNGAAGGLLWLAGLFVMTALVMALIMAWAPSHAMSLEEKRVFLTLGLYAFAYALTALAVQRKFFPRRPPKLAGLLAVLLAGGWAIAPSIFLFFVNRLSWSTVEGLQLGNVFNVGYIRESSQVVWHEFFALGWLLLMLVLNARWFVRQWANFKPLPAAVPPALQEIGG